MSNEVDIKVKVQHQIENLDQQQNFLSKQNNLLTPKKSASFEKVRSTIDRIMAKDTWDLNDLTQISAAMSSWTNLINKLKLTMTDATQATKDYNKELAILEKKEQVVKNKFNEEFRKIGKSSRTKGKYGYLVEGLTKEYTKELFDIYQNDPKHDPIKNGRGQKAGWENYWRARQDQNSEAYQKFSNNANFEKELLNKRSIIQKNLNNIDNTIINIQQAIEKLIANPPEDLKENKEVTQNIHDNNELLKELDLKRTQLTSHKDDGDNTATINNLTSSINKQQSALGKAFKAFTIYGLILKGAKKALNEVVSTIKELDKSLTEQAMVTGKTRQETYALVKSYQQLALETGATTKEVASVATEYMKQGKTIEDSMVLTKAAISAAKVARVSVGDSVNYLTTALNGFRLSANDAMLVSDKFAAVAASSATDYDELAIALSKVASQANLAGMSIDYTTALLTKGLETTREAPETMGTALKTIIARMREMTDYGRTLEGDTDINNVESQLAYVGIALRNQEGELRSTEAVLDELGKKWDTLTKNQQAALAKALAGTRQQSRLIAMMDDYERVTELQEIAQRSQGATLAQAETYLEGIEASLNKVSVAWEDIVTSLTNSDLITGLIDKVANILSFIGEALDQTWVQVSLFTVIGVALTGIIAKKQIENQIAKEQLALQHQQYVAQLKKRKEELISQILTGDSAKLKKEELDLIIAQLKAQVKLNQARKNKKVSNAEIKELEEISKRSLANLGTVEGAANKVTEAMKGTSLAGKELASIEEQLTFVETQYNDILGIGVSILSSKTAFQAISTGMQKIAIPIIRLFGRVTHEAAVKTAMAHAALLGWIGVGIIAVGIGATLITGFIDMSSATEKASKKIQEFSNQIYKMTESIHGIDTAIDKFEELDNKILKTNKDLEEMNTIAKGLEDTIDFTIGGTKDEKAANKLKENFKKMTSSEQIEEAKRLRKELDKVLNEKRQEIVKQFYKKGVDQDSLLKEHKNVLRSIEKSQLYQQIDKISTQTNSQGLLLFNNKELKEAEKILSNIIDNLDSKTLLRWSNTNGEVFQDLITNLASVEKIEIENLANQKEEVSILELLSGEGYKLEDKVKALQKASEAVQNNAEALKALHLAYNDLFSFIDNGENGLEIARLADELNLTTEDINLLGKAMNSIGISKEKFMQVFKDLTTQITREGANVKEIIKDMFSPKNGFNEEDWEEVFKAWVDATTIGIANIGQNMDALTNKINNFYEVSNKWNTMKESEKAAFISDNRDIFENNEALLAAFESQNYEQIEKALKQSEFLHKEVERRKKEIEAELAVTEDAAERKFLETQLAELNSRDLYKADLSFRIDMEKKQLDIYKKYLQKQTEALQKANEEKKKSYQAYFDAINKDKEDEDYETNRNLITDNLAKIASTTNASTNQTRAELEKKLADLDKERQAEIRKRAQEAIIQNLDNQVDEINKKMDTLIDNEKLLKDALLKSLGQSNFINDLAGVLTNGSMTDLQVQSFVNELQGIFSSVLPNLDWNSVQQTTNKTNNANVSINGEVVNLTQIEQERLVKQIMQALHINGWAN